MTMTKCWKAASTGALSDRNVEKVYWGLYCDVGTSINRDGFDFEVVEDEPIYEKGWLGWRQHSNTLAMKKKYMCIQH